MITGYEITCTIVHIPQYWPRWWHARPWPGSSDPQWLWSPPPGHTPGCRHNMWNPQYSTLHLQLLCFMFLSTLVMLHMLCQLSLPKISTRSLMLIAFSPLMGWVSLAPKAQLPSEGSNNSVESRISAPSHPPATKKIWQQNWMKFKIFSILCHFISPSSLLTCSWYRHAGISQCWGKGGPPASPGCCTLTRC